MLGWDLGVSEDGRTGLVGWVKESVTKIADEVMERGEERERETARARVYACACVLRCYVFG